MTIIPTNTKQNLEKLLNKYLGLDKTQEPIIEIYNVDLVKIIAFKKLIFEYLANININGKND